MKHNCFQFAFYFYLNWILIIHHKRAIQILKANETNLIKQYKKILDPIKTIEPSKQYKTKTQIVVFKIQ